MTPQDVLALVRKRNNFTSDQQVADAVSRDRVSVAKWKSGKVIPDEKATESLARLAGLNTDVLLAQRQVWITTGTTRARWERIVKTLTRAAAALSIMCVAIMGQDVPALANAGSYSAEHIHYATIAREVAPIMVSAAISSL